MKKLTIFDVANYFLKIVDRESGSTITPLKLQKILYYAQGYHLAMFGTPLFDEEFEAWAHGPANPEIYNRYKECGFEAIKEPEEDIPAMDEETTKFLNDIWETFGMYDGKYLEKMTHEEEPWINARKGYDAGEVCNKIITKKSMKEFFEKIINA